MCVYLPGFIMKIRLIHKSQPQGQFKHNFKNELKLLLLRALLFFFFFAVF